MTRMIAALALTFAIATTANALDTSSTDNPKGEPPGLEALDSPDDPGSETLNSELPEPPMTLQRLGEIILVLDPEAQSAGNSFKMSIDDVPVFIVTDPLADRMRAMVPIRSVDTMSAEDVLRVMQANFDTALDARYAIAQGRLWGVYIHPLSPLEKNEFISGLAQAVNLATTYGSLYTGGALTFRGGDSAPLQRQLIDDLLKKGEEI